PSFAAYYTTPLVHLPMTRPPTNSSLFPYTTLFRSPHFPWLAKRPDWRTATGVVTAIGRNNWPCPESLKVRRKAIVRIATFVSERSEEHTSELQLRENLVCRLLLEKKKRTNCDKVLY